MKRWMLIILFVLFLTGPVNAYTYVRYVDTGSADGDGTEDRNDGATAAYASLQTGETAMDGVVGAGESIVFYCKRTNGGGVDASVTFDEWDATAEITVIQTDFPATGIYDGDKYVIHNNEAATNAVYVRENYVTLTNLQILVTATGAHNGIYFIDQLETNNASVIDSCIIKGICSGSGSSGGILIYGEFAKVTVMNTIVYGFISGADTGFGAITAVSSTTADVYNCTVSGSYYGIRRIAGTFTAINCAVFNNTDDFDGTIGVTYSVSDDTQAGTGNIDWDAGATDWAAAFVGYSDTPANFTAKTGGDLIDNGNGATPKGVFTVDIIDTDRSGLADLDWDIGAFEYVAVGGSVVPILVNIQNQ